MQIQPVRETYMYVLPVCACACVWGKSSLYMISHDISTDQRSETSGCWVVLEGGRDNNYSADQGILFSSAKFDIPVSTTLGTTIQVYMHHTH